MTELQYLDKIATCAQVSMIALIVIAVLVLIATQKILNMKTVQDESKDDTNDKDKK
jgi:1,4-dihydroxy-2-naphthoate octaprenyltransferase